LRYFIAFSYNGKKYHGFQRQPDASSVQETLETALSTIIRKPIAIVGAGRTDAGVHAKQMYAHFDLEESINEMQLTKKLNAFLDENIAIHAVFTVSDDAHARFDATSRTYHYFIHTQKDVFWHDRSWYYQQKLDISLMNEACKLLFDYTDFECFSKVHTDVNTFNCSIQEAYWEQKGNQLIFTIKADRFLRNMVRAIVGTMINIGTNKITLEDFKAIIESKDRGKAGFSVPAHGLYLVAVEYPFIDENQFKKE